ncbi:type II secretion system protein [Aquabacterium sp.]|uniref:pilus assembly FimT family protein n=1 Tax=Aquabacterium sp. TaxID=1872578 RepID=UPI002489DB8E|nr:type II secretion system protein [Aquabacterium sp.]MDI1347965.1 type II secretion system protein [Aquabacterium sp.]
MCQTSSERHQAGYTVIELIVVMVLLSILSVSAMPYLGSATGMRDDAWRDQVVVALWHARSTAVTHRRVVCVSFTATTVSLAMARNNPATACDLPVPSPDGRGTFAQAANSAAATSVSPTGVLYFQPGGRVTTALGGGATAQWTVSLQGVAPVRIEGATGHVE